MSRISDIHNLLMFKSVLNTYGPVQPVIALLKTSEVLNEMLSSASRYEIVDVIDRLIELSTDACEDDNSTISFESMVNVNGLMYHGAPTLNRVLQPQDIDNAENTVKKGVKLTPYEGIASIDSIDIRQVFDGVYYPSVHVVVDERNLSTSKLTSALSEVTIRHNAESMINDRGVSTGYIYTVDHVRDKLNIVALDNSEREFVSTSKNIPYKKAYPHMMKWTRVFDKNLIGVHGPATEIKELVVNYVIPYYNKNDVAHTLKHADDVYNLSMKLARYANYKRIDLVTIAAYMHDVSVSTGRKLHHEYGAKEVLSNNFKRKFSMYSQDEIELVAAAVREHRASYNGTYTSILSEIISSADRGEPVDPNKYLFPRIISTSMGGTTEEEKRKEAADHLYHKYGRHGSARYPQLYRDYYKTELEIWFRQIDEIAKKYGVI